MQLYTGVSSQFIELVDKSQIEYIIEHSFQKQMGYSPSPSEVNSWKNSLKAMSYVIKDTGLYDLGVIVEYVLPYSSSRLDIMLTGKNRFKKPNAVIIELKQWEKAYYKGINDCVEVFPNSPLLHPSAQAGGYAEYLEDVHTAFYESDENPELVNLEACSFLHNARRNSCGDLNNVVFADILSKYPMFTGDMSNELVNFLSDFIGNGEGEAVLNKVLQSSYRPSKKLLENVSRIIKGNPVFQLLDEQKIVFNAILSLVKDPKLRESKATVIVVGGPGTGKSVIAVNLLAELAMGNYNVMHCTGSAAFTTNLRAQIGSKGTRIFRYFNSFSKLDYNNFDVLIADEAHRIRETSNGRFTRIEARSGKSQVEELIDAAKVSLFLLDYNQIVRPKEIGTPELIESVAKSKGIKTFKINLNTQFRCSGSESYIAWLDYVLNIGGRFDLSWRNNGEYLFEIVESPSELEKKILEKAVKEDTARLVAGFCWPWSDPKNDGSLADDVVIGTWSKPWNRKRGKNYCNPSNDPYTIWATKQEGLTQIGCIYSAQGFEFDYTGVIFGNDVIWNKESKEWIGLQESSCDPVLKKSKNDFAKLILHTYKVLLSRGIKGTYVYFLDKSTKEYFKEMLISL